MTYTERLNIKLYFLFRVEMDANEDETKEEDTVEILKLVLIMCLELG